MTEWASSPEARRIARTSSVPYAQRRSAYEQTENAPRNAVLLRCLTALDVVSREWVDETAEHRDIDAEWLARWYRLGAAAAEWPRAACELALDCLSSTPRRSWYWKR